MNNDTFAGARPRSLAARAQSIAERLVETPVRTVVSPVADARDIDARIGCGPLLLSVSGPHGARLERTSSSAPRGAMALVPPDRLGALPPFDARPETTAAVWEAIARGARLVGVGRSDGDGVTTLFAFLASEAATHGFADGVVRLTDADAYAGDVTQRIAARLAPGAQPRVTLDADLARIADGARALILIERAALTAAGEREVVERFRRSCVVVADSAVEAMRPAQIALGPLHPQSVVALLEAGSGRHIDADNRRMALTLCGDFAASPGRIRLVGVAMRVFDRSLVSLYVRYGTGERIPRALVANLTPAEQSVLQVLALARAPLAAHHLAYVMRRGDMGALLDTLVAYELIRAAGGDTYELPSYVEPFVPPLGDEDRIRARLVDIFRDLCDSATMVPVSDRQLAAAQALLACAPDGIRAPVLTLGPRLAAVYAARAEFGAWTRSLTLVERAACAVGDLTRLNAARHDLGVRTLLLGSCAVAAGYLAAAARERLAAGDDAGAAHSAALAAVAGMLASASDADDGRDGPVDDALPLPAALAVATPGSRRSRLAPAALAGLLAAVVVIASATVSRRAAEPPPSAGRFSAQPAWVKSATFDRTATGSRAHP